MSHEQPRRSRSATTAAAKPQRLSARQHASFALVVLLALAMRGGYLSGQQQHNPFFEAPRMDELKHHEWARGIARGEGFGELFDDKPYFRAPLYFYLLAGVYSLFGPDPLAGRILGCLLGAASCYLITRFGTTLAGYRTGLLAGLVSAVYWPFVHFDVLLLTVTLEVFLNLLLLIMLWHAMRRDSLPLFALGGVVWGLSALTRPTALALLPAILLWLWVGRPLAQRQTRPWLAALLTVGCAAVTILPATIRNRVVGGEWVLIATNGGVNFYIGNNPLSDGVAAIVPNTRPTWEGGYIDTHVIAKQELGRSPSEKEVSAYWYRKAFAWIRSDPAGWLRLTWLKFRLFWSPLELYNNNPIRFFARMSALHHLFWVGFPVVACLGIAGITTRWREWRAWFLPGAYALTGLATTVAFFCPGRYRLPAVPVLILLAAAGLVRLPALLRERYLRTLAAYATVGTLCALFVFTNPPPWDHYFQYAAGQAHYHLGLHHARLAESQPTHRDQAIEHFEKALELRPDDALMPQGIAVWYARLGLPGHAQGLIARAAAAKSSDPQIRMLHVNGLLGADRNEEALDFLLQSSERSNFSLLERETLGRLLLKLGRVNEGRRQLEMAVEEGSRSSEVYVSLGQVAGLAGDLETSAGYYESALRHNPEDLSAQRHLAALLGELGRYAEAAEYYRDLHERLPDDRNLPQQLANSLRHSGHAADAKDVLERALKRWPIDAELLKELAWLLATSRDDTIRDGQRALQLANRAIEQTDRINARLLETLAAACAEVGQFDKAVDITRPLVEAAERSGKPEVAAQIRQRLKLYENRQPYRE